MTTWERNSVVNNIIVGHLGSNQVALAQHWLISCVFCWQFGRFLSTSYTISL